MDKHKAALRHLAKQDPVMAGLIKRLKLEPLELRKNHFAALVRSIIAQQLSTKVARTLNKRFLELYGGKFPPAETIIGTAEKKLRGIGLSFQKVSYIKNLAAAVANGQINFKKLVRQSDEEIIAQLTRIKGIGRWTAEMFLIFSLGHMDVYSHADLGLKNAVKKLYNIDPKFHTRKLKKLLDTWAPYKSHASRLLWKSLDL